MGGEVIYNTHSPNPRDSDLFSLKLGLGVGIFENTPQWFYCASWIKIKSYFPFLLQKPRGTEVIELVNGRGQD